MKKAESPSALSEQISSCYLLLACIESAMLKNKSFLGL